MKCAGDQELSSGPCPKCGATDDDRCPYPARPEIEGEREHYSILNDGENRFVLCDDRSDDPAPVYPSLEAAEAALNRIVSLL